MASPPAQQTSSNSGWRSQLFPVSEVTRAGRLVGSGLNWVFSKQDIPNILEQFPERKPDLIAISDFSPIVPCSYVGVKTHVLQRLEEAKEEESAQNAEYLDQVRRAVINQSKTCLEDDDMAGLTLHLRNFAGSFATFPESQLRQRWDEFVQQCPDICQLCKNYLDNKDIPGLIKQTDWLKKVFTHLPSDDLDLNWPRFVKWRKKELATCLKYLKRGQIKELADYVKTNKLFPIKNPEAQTKDQWQDELSKRQIYLDACCTLLQLDLPENPDAPVSPPKRATPRQLASVIQYAVDFTDLYPYFPGKDLATQWASFINSRLQSIAKPVTFDKKFVPLALGLPACDNYDTLMYELELEMHRWNAELLEETKNPNHPQIKALHHCAELMKAGDFEKLMFEVRNYQFCFNPLFSNFPFDQVQAAYLKSKNMTVEEYTPKNLRELAERFKHMSARFADDTDKKTKQYNPNSRVYSQIMATRYIGENQMDNFVNLYHRSKWLQEVFPQEFLPCIVATHEKNKLFDQALIELMKPLDACNRDSATDRIISTANACLMQKNVRLWNRIDEALSEEYSQLMAKKDRQILEAQEQQRPLRWSDYSETKMNDAKMARMIFTMGKWQELNEHLKARLPDLHSELKTELKVLLENSLVDEFLYWPQVVATRAVMTYKSCMAKGTEEDFLKMCQPDPKKIPFDHWTMRLKRSEFSELRDALHEAYAYEPGVKERVEKAFTRHMPQKMD